jgi:hypothetical protein
MDKTSLITDELKTGAKKTVARTYIRTGVNGSN